MPLDGRGFEQQDDVLDLLRRARERVANGWCQYRVWSHDMQEYCAWGSLEIEEIPAARKAEAMIRLSMELPTENRRRPNFYAGQDVIIFNNASGRTQAEIVALFDAAIAAREAEGARA
jgi:hypothetical protein